jgi:TetR/AcrR family transcriptional regulator, copper-responsive repressor
MKQRPEPPARGRPRSFDRQAALEAALHVFWQYGYDAASLAELTAAMNITPPSLYAAFGSKKELFFEAVELYAATYGAGAARALEEAPSAREAIKSIMLEAAASFCGPAHPQGCFFVLGATNCAPGSADVEAALRDRRIQNEGALRARIRRGIKEGELPAGTNASALAKFYGAVVQGMSVQARDGASRKELEGIVRAALLAWPAPPR